MRDRLDDRKLFSARKSLHFLRKNLLKYLRILLDSARVIE